MIIITVPCQNNKTRCRTGGFTLTEVLIAMTLSSMILAGILSSFVFVGRSSLSIANYSDMNSESRVGLEIFGRDVRSAKDVKSGFSEHSFTLEVPVEGGGDEEITYEYRPDEPNNPLVRIDSSGEKVLMSKVENLQFKYYNLRAEEAEVRLEVKQIQLQLKLVRQALSLQNTEKVVSARFILRNKKVST